MASEPAKLRKVDGEIPKKDAFLVRVIRLWTVPSRDDPERIRSIEMVLQDDEGNDSDDDLDLWFSKGDANDSSVPNLEADKEDSNTPLSKCRLDEDDDCNGDTPSTQNSSNKKMKNIKIEKA